MPDREKQPSFFADVKRALPIVAVMTPLSFAKNWGEEAIQAAVENRLGKLNKKLSFGLRLDRLSGKRILSPTQRKIFSKLHSKVRSDVFRRSAGRGLGAALMGAMTGLVQTSLISRVLR